MSLPESDKLKVDEDKVVEELEALLRLKEEKTLKEQEERKTENLIN